MSDFHCHQKIVDLPFYENQTKTYARLKCYGCEDEFNIENELACRIQSIHGACFQYEKCKRTFESATDIRSNMKMHHIDSSFLGNRFESKKNLMNHIESIHNSSEYLNFLVSPLKDIINSCLMEQIFPDEWKIT